MGGSGYILSSTICQSPNPTFEPCGTLEYPLGNLKPNTPYEFSVRAFNGCLERGQALYWGCVAGVLQLGNVVFDPPSVTFDASSGAGSSSSSSAGSDPSCAGIFARPEYMHPGTPQRAADHIGSVVGLIVGLHVSVYGGTW